MEASATITTSMETNDTTMEEVTITTQVDRNKETTIAHTTSKKKVTTIFVMKKAKAKVPMPKMTSKKEIATPKHKEEVTTSNEELLEAVNVTKKDQEDKRNNEEEEAPPVTSIDSDEELLQAAIKLEDLQLSGHDQEGAPLVAHHQVGGQQDARHQEAGHKLNLMPSQRLTKRHPDGAQGWKGEQNC